MLVKSLKELKVEDPTYAKELLEGYQNQRKFFFDRRIDELNKMFMLDPHHEKILWGYLLAAEQPKDEAETKEFHILDSMSLINIEEELLEKKHINNAYLGWLKVYWSKAWGEYAYENRAFLSARFVLQSIKNKISNYFGAENELIDELNSALPKADKHINSVEYKNKISTIDGKKILELDIKALEYFKLHNIGSFSNKTILYFNEILKSSDYDIKQRIRFWDDPLFLSKRIAVCRWHDIVKKIVACKSVNPPAFSLTIATKLVELNTLGNKIDESKSKILNDKNTIIANFEPSACIPLATAKDIVSRDIEALNSILAKRILRFYALRAYEQHVLNVKKPNEISLDGGFYTLAENIGAGTNAEAIKKIKKIIALYAGCKYEIEFGDKKVFGNILMYEFSESKRGKSQHLHITVARALCPGFVLGNNEDSRYSTNKLLLPIIHKEPPFIGKKNSFCSQMNFLDWTLIEMRLRAVELYERGGIFLNFEHWLEIAQKAKMSKNLITKLIDCWIAEGYLEKTGTSLFSLGDKYENERKMLALAGEKTFKGSIAAKKRKKSKESIYMKENGSPF